MLVHRSGIRREEKLSETESDMLMVWMKSKGKNCLAKSLNITLIIVLLLFVCWLDKSQYKKQQKYDRRLRAVQITEKRYTPDRSDQIWSLKPKFQSFWSWSSEASEASEVTRPFVSCWQPWERNHVDLGRQAFEQNEASGSIKRGGASPDCSSVYYIQGSQCKTVTVDASVICEK